ncbi:hypothetical protein [Pedobacter sp. JY14-1]|uniref:glycosyl-4,4'-diaponeurosporenoate acyltransferase CrtO family protein n=1 Tax=Pedobacter sp. JY14-1 TaxID=3034151 RepID=UPI0023E32B2E|nr:hypothetical protein [Pedobacter sp. JY14-1]
MKKQLTLTLIVIVSIGAVYAMAKFIKMDTFPFAWALNFLLMGCVGFFSDAQQSDFNSPYFDEKKWERGGEIYEYLGVNVFRRLLVLVGWEKLTRKALPIGNDTASLSKLYVQTKKSEQNHIIIFIIVLGFNVYVALKFGFTKSVWLLVLNVLLHLYPILLQRYNRPRIKRILRLSERRNSCDNRDPI